MTKPMMVVLAGALMIAVPFGGLSIISSLSWAFHVGQSIRR